MSYLFTCSSCNKQLGEGAYNPEHRLDEPCIRQFNMYCTEEGDPRCDACNQVQVVEASIPNPCWENLDALYEENCGAHSSRSPVVPSTHSTASNTSAPKESEESSLGMVPVVFFIILVVAVMLFICKKMWEYQTKNNNDEHLLSEDGASIRLDVHQPIPVAGEYDNRPHCERVDADSGYPPRHSHHSSSSHNTHEYQPQFHGRQHSDQRYSAGSFQSLSNASSHSREDAYHYQPNGRQYRPEQDHHSEGSYTRKDHDMNYNVPNSHRHQPYADSEERILDAQDSLRSVHAQKESLRSRIAKARLQNVLPSVHKTQSNGPGPEPEPVLPQPEPPQTRARNDSSTNQRQTRINTLLNQNASTSSIYSGSVLYPAKPLQQDENSPSKECESKGISDSGKSNNEVSDPEVPLRERIQRYSRSQERERRDSGSSKEPEVKRRSLVREDKRRSAERNSKSAENRFDREREFEDGPGPNVPLRERIQRYSQNRSSEPASEPQSSKVRRDRSRPRETEPSPLMFR